MMSRQKMINYRQLLKSWLKSLLRRIDIFFVKICSKNRLTAVLYYAFKPAFGREQLAVLAGRAQHAAEQVAPDFSSAQLRRNIHRLEKALIMRPRKSLFALDYIDETIHLYERCHATPVFSGPELAWAHAVLSQYFSVVSHTEKIRQLAIRFEQLPLKGHVITSCNAALTPYPAEDKVVADISPDSLHLLMRQRRSVRWFTETPVPADVIAQAIEMASQAPSACNRQPFFVKISQDAAQAASIAKLAMGTSGFADNIRCLCVIVGDQSCYEAERDRHVIYVDGGLFAMQLMLALETLGLSSCPINWPDIESLEVKMQRRLKLAVFHRPVMLLAVGYADQTGGIPASVKKTSEQLLQTIED